MYEVMQKRKEVVPSLQLNTAGPDLKFLTKLVRPTFVRFLHQLHHNIALPTRKTTSSLSISST
jgi:hypothetical protein